LVTMSKSLCSGVNKVYFRSYLLLNIVASSAFINHLLLFILYSSVLKALVMCAKQFSNGSP
jgi:hypothetical protein